MVPVGVIPTGKTNKFATYFFGSDKQKVRYMDTVYLFTLYIIYFNSVSLSKRIIQNQHQFILVCVGSFRII